MCMRVLQSGVSFCAANCCQQSGQQFFVPQQHARYIVGSSADAAQPKCCKEYTITLLELCVIQLCSNNMLYLCAKFCNVGRGLGTSCQMLVHDLNNLARASAQGRMIMHNVTSFVGQTEHKTSNKINHEAGTHAPTTFLALSSTVAHA